MCELGYETTPEEMTWRLQSILENFSYKTLVAEVEGEICGMIGTFVQPSYEHDDRKRREDAVLVGPSW